MKKPFAFALTTTLWLTLALPCAVADLASSSAPEVPPEEQTRPRIGLVLGGGGAKGAAHVGVLQVMEELRIPVDCVTGASMGALVGGTYATGATPLDIRESILGIDWTQTVGGKGLRDKTPIHAKLTGRTARTGFEFGVGKRGLKTPAGLIGSQEVEGVIRRLVQEARYTRDFDNLAIPFRAIATDIVSGDMVVLDRGDLSVAMRASMAIPGVFSPVARDGQVLVDGGITRNLPVDVARDLCADVVIAVWFESPEPTAEELSSPIALARRSVDVMVIANERVQIDSLTAADVGIGVFVDDIGVSDFLRAEEAIEKGRGAAETLRAELGRYSMSEQDYAKWRASAQRPADAAGGSLAGVEIKGLQRVNPGYLRSKLEYALPGQAVSDDGIASDIDRIFALGDFERVDYRLKGPAGRRILEIRPVEKSWGPDFLNLDFGLASNGDEDPRAILRADHLRTWMNPRGGQWHTAAQIGQKSFLSTDFYQPLDIEQRFFIQPLLNVETSLEDIYADEDRIARYFFRERFAQIDAGMNIGTRAQIRAGLQRRRFSTGLDTGLPGLPEAEGDDTALQIRFVYDTRDDVGLPTDGTYVNLSYRDSLDWFGNTEDYRIAEGVATRAFNIGGHSLSLIAGGGDTMSGTAPVTDEIRLGGIRTFPGLRRGELLGRRYWFAGTTYLWRLGDIEPLSGQSLFAGLRLSAGEMEERLDGIDEGTLFGIAGSLRGRTPLGAFELSLGYVNNRSLRLQFSVGRPLDEGSLLDTIY